MELYERSEILLNRIKGNTTHVPTANSRKFELRYHGNEQSVELCMELSSAPQWSKRAMGSSWSLMTVRNVAHVPNPYNAMLMFRNTCTARPNAANTSAWYETVPCLCAATARICNDPSDKQTRRNVNRTHPNIPAL